MLAKSHSAALCGIEVIHVVCEVDNLAGLTKVNIVGLPDATVKESVGRVRSAIKNCGYDFMNGIITVNLSPADVKKEGPAFDLPIALALMAGNGNINQEKLSEYVIMGELSLDGGVRPVKGILPVTLDMCHKFRKIIVPFENMKEASVSGEMEVYPVKTLSEAVEVINSGTVAPYTPQEDIFEIMSKISYTKDYSEVKGQESARRAMEIAAAGGHNILLIGSPGSGKSMLSQRLPTILPPLTKTEALDVTKIYSVKGLLSADTPIITHRKFRSPHHTISAAGMVGGGPVPSPGEISLSHHGVLFLDEFPEFDRDVLEVLRQPLEDGVITISRATASLTYPSEFILVAAMNPCPCGYYGDSEKECTCTAVERRRYLKKISGPLLDRIDIHIEVPRLKKDELIGKAEGEPSEDIRKRVISAREIQTERFMGTKILSNSHMTGSQLKKYATLDQKCENILGNAINSLQLSARAYDKILKVSRTIADLDMSENIKPEHILEAVSYRTLSKKYWN